MKKTIWLIPAAIFLLIVIVLSVLPFFLDQKAIQEKVVSSLKAKTNIDFEIGSLGIRFLPVPTVTVSNFTVPYPESEDGKVLIKAKKLVLKPKLLKFLRKKYEFSSINLRGADINILLPRKEEALPEFIRLENTNLRLSRLVSKKKSPFEASGAVFGGENNFDLKGTMVLDFSGGVPKIRAIEAQLELEKINLKRPGDVFLSESGIKITGGKLSGKSTFSLHSSEITVDFKSETRVKALFLGGPLLENEISLGDLKFDLNGDFKTDSRAINIGSLDVTGTFGAVKAEGEVNLTEGKEDIDFMVSTAGINLGTVEKLVSAVKSDFMRDLSLKGPVSGNVFIKGNKQILKLDTTFDFEEAEIRYSDLFDKPRKYPFSVSTKIKVTGMEFLDGDVDVNLADINLKGTLVNFSAETYSGKFNFITNMFNAENLAKAVVPLSEYKPKGGLKVLMHFDGNPDDFKNLKLSANLTFENTNFTYEGMDIGKVKGSLDIERDAASFRDGSLRIGESDFQVKLDVSNFSEPQFSFDLKSSRLNLDEIQKIVKESSAKSYSGKSASTGSAEDKLFAVSGRTAPDKPVIPADITSRLAEANGKGKITVAELVYQDKNFSNVLGVLKAENGKFFLNPLLADGLGGKITLAVTADFSPEEPSYRLDIVTEKLKVSEFMKKNRISGDLSFKGTFETSGSEKAALENRLTGSGDLKLENGEFKTFSALKILSAFSTFGFLSSHAEEGTGFTTATADINVKDEKVHTEKFFVDSPEFGAVGSGYFDFNGNINYRGKLALESFLSRKSSKVVGEKERLQVPFSVSGRFEKPNVRFDVNVIKTVVSGLLRTALLQRKPDQTAVSGETAPQRSQPIGAETTATGTIGGAQESPSAVSSPEEEALKTGLSLLSGILGEKDTDSGASES